VGDKFKGWDNLLENLKECGASPADLIGMKHVIDTAKDSVIAKNLSNTAFTGVSVGLAVTGAGLPAALAVEVGGLVTGWVWDKVEEKETRNVETEAANIRNGLDDCEEEEEEECPPGVKCDDNDEDPSPTRNIVADPYWKIDPSGFVYEVNEDNRRRDQPAGYIIDGQLPLGCSGRLVAGHVS